MTDEKSSERGHLIHYRLQAVRDEAFFRALIPNRILYLLVPTLMHIVLLAGYGLFVDNPINWGLYADGTRHGYGTLRVALALLSVAFLVYLYYRSRRDLAYTTEKWVLRMTGIAYFSGTTVETAIDVANGGSPAMFSFTVLAAAMILYEPRRVIIPLFTTGMVAVVSAGIFWGSGLYSDTILIVQPIVAALWGWGIYAVTISNRYGMWTNQRELARKTKQLEHSQARLREAVRLKQTVLTAVGHDLRAPIAMVKNLVRVLEGPGHVYESNRRPIREELDRTIRSAELTMRALLALYGKPTDGFGYAIGPVSLDSVCREVETIMRGVGNQKGVVINFAPVEDVIIHGNSSMLVTVLRNLIDNAVKFTPPSGAVHVQCHIESAHVRFEVVDTGIGISNEAQIALDRHISMESTPGTEGETGLGLGLSVCSTFLMAQDSKLQLQPHELGGTTASFSLPRYSAMRGHLSDSQIDELPTVS